jgi:hypothetical protein
VLSEKPAWAKKGQASDNLKKTGEGEKLKSGDGNLAKPITNIREHMENEGK